MSTVQTIRGPVDSSSLGWTLSHEHLTAGGAGMQSFPWIYDEADALKADLDALRRARDAGIASLIDLTPFDLGRQITLFEKVAEADPGVHVICATGVYRWVPMYFLGRPVDEIAEHFLRELQDGVQGSAIRAGIIKVAWDQEYQLDDGPEGATVRAGLERSPPGPGPGRRGRARGGEGSRGADFLSHPGGPGTRHPAAGHLRG